MTDYLKILFVKFINHVCKSYYTVAMFAYYAIVNYVRVMNDSYALFFGNTRSYFGAGRHLQKIK